MNQIYVDYMAEVIGKLVNTPSPSGYIEQILPVVREEAQKLGYSVEVTPTGAMVIDVPGEDEESKDVLCLAAHVDTLGAMVRSVTAQGTLKIMSVGGYMFSTIEGEYCKIHSRRTGKTFTGTVLTTSPSVHVHDDAYKLERVEKSREIRIDERVASKEDVIALGIDAGDYVSFEPRFEYTESGFIKSRHLDDKASAGVLFGVLKYMKDNNLVPNQHVKIMLTSYEEIGRGASWLPENVTSMLAVDMGCVGDDLSGDEYHVSICAMDSAGPYDYQMTNTLMDLAKRDGIGYVVDVFPHYSSDASAAMRGGNPIRAALIGQGVQASHSMERTHIDGVYQTFKLVLAYLGVKVED